MDTKRPIFGRDSDITILSKIINLKKSKIIVVYGRRRIGKTTLIQHVLKDKKVIKIEGIEGQSEKYQRENFIDQFALYLNDKNISKIKTKNWKETLMLLNECIKDKECVVYLEEVQWIADYKNHLIPELKYVWDNYWQHNPKLTLILCGSSPSFMIQQVMKSSALYNRSQHEFPVDEICINSIKGIIGEKKSAFEILDAYLAVGGIPEYLQYLKQESSVYLSLCSQCSTKGGYFVNEAERIFVSSLSKFRYYKEIIELLALQGDKTRPEIEELLSMPKGGTTSRVFEDLLKCGFIGSYAPNNFGDSSKNSKYYCKDRYLNLYYKFIKPNLLAIYNDTFKDAPITLIPFSKYRQWLGYSLERYCIQNHTKIAKILGFSAVSYSAGPYYVRKRNSIKNLSKEDQILHNAQIDLLFIRKDKVITLCEIKYQEQKPGLEVVAEVENKITALNLSQKFKNYTVQCILISPNGASKELIEKGYFSKIIEIGELIA